MFRKSTLFVAAFSSLLLVGSTVPSRAQINIYNRCEQRVRKAEENLDKAIKKYGKDSREAGQRKRELVQQKQKCMMEERHGH